MLHQVPTPGATYTIPDPTNINPDKTFDWVAGLPSGVWTVVAAVIIIAVCSAIFKALPWRIIGPAAIVLVILILLFKR